MCVCVAASAVPSARADVVKVTGQHFEDKEIGLSQENSVMHEYTNKQTHGRTLLCHMQGSRKWQSVCINTYIINSAVEDSV